MYMTEDKVDITGQLWVNNRQVNASTREIKENIPSNSYPTVPNAFSAHPQCS
jgi:hypothetical protein